tara:strand:- start:35 stop:289 length:255 start_codon:yes stop_codon:yes gene_type:complete
MNYSFVSFFCGAGGFDLGFEKAKFQHVYSSDIDLACTLTIKENRKNWDVECRDILFTDANNLYGDVLLAGFPCQGFSLGGHRKL